MAVLCLTLQHTLGIKQQPIFYAAFVKSVLVAILGEYATSMFYECYPSFFTAGYLLKRYSWTTGYFVTTELSSQTASSYMVPLFFRV